MNKSVILIYTPKKTPRLKYIFDFIFIELLGITFSFTDNLDVFSKSDLLKILYAQDYISVSNSLFLSANKLLFEDETKPQKIDVYNWGETKAFFKTDNQSFIPFDIFAAGFYLLSRYEEYLDFEPDKYNRFSAKQSLAYKHQFIKQPVIDIWAEYLKKTLLSYNAELKFKEKDFTYISTIDIDNAYAFLHKGIIRAFFSSLKLILSCRWNEFIEKTVVHLGKKADPYDSYQFLEKTHLRFNVQAIYFFLTAKYAKNDKNISPDNKQFKNLVRSVMINNEIGIHPSFASNNSVTLLKYEREKLKGVCGKEIYKSRQHFLMLKFPDTYQNLIKLGIKEDYSMGYVSVTGFRAGTCTPFYFYNLEKNITEKLKIIPFALMDVGLKDYNGLNAEEATEEIENIIENVKKVNGLFVSLWHNESLGSKKNWKKWKNTYLKMIQKCNEIAKNEIN